MMRMVKFLLIVASTIHVLSCTKEPQKKMELDPRYREIESIHAVANCKGPKGTYTTETRARADTFYFAQRFTYRDQPFIAYMVAGAAVELDTTGTIKDTLKAEVAEAIRSHNLHFIAMRPKQFYDSIRFAGEEMIGGKLMDRYNGIDAMHHKVDIIYDPVDHVITQVSFSNPIDAKEKITMNYSDWKETDFGKHARHVEIIQGDAGSFIFDFFTLEMNAPQVSTAQH